MLSLASSDPDVRFPDGMTYDMLGGDTSGHTFRVVLGSTGSQTISVSSSEFGNATSDSISVAATHLVASYTTASDLTATPPRPFSGSLTPSGLSP
jgi:hypothetical protein